MESGNSWFGSYLDAVWDQIKAGADYFPTVLAAVLLLVIGWIIARLARHAIERLAAASNSFLERTFPSGILAEARVSTLVATLLGEIAFWAILVITVTIAAGIAGLGAVAKWLDRITAYLPSLIAGIAIVVAGFFLSVYIREKVAPRTATDESRQRLLLGRVAQSIVIAMALIVGLDQIGIDVALLVALFVVSVAALLGGLAASFAMGSRSHVSNLIGVRSARRYLSAGVRIRIDDIEGEILEITPTQVALTTEEGKILVPGRFIDEHAVIIVTPDVDQERRDA
ncbi:MAG: mechanosensitive ion channel [Gammaproteobacteria bacterium]|nr:mechanosensitive ion channel [Gammaproteobacteria bacterium]MDH3352415.1 mechanosensitive ion channel [Gammaproteobacteria bacterium]